MKEKSKERQCANCFVCVRNTELCPLNENYQELPLDQWLKRVQEIKKEEQNGD
ncbi:MAG: hypothetical protein H0Z35_02915 [Thermoanaerobacteraceae bacterium]|nr:hypothetical protein [Thermoanaerobacteraceae bacterium]